MSKAKDAGLKIGLGLHPKPNQLGTLQFKPQFKEFTPFASLCFSFCQAVPRTFIF